MKGFLKWAAVGVAVLVASVVGATVESNYVNDGQTITCKNGTAGTWTLHDLVLVGKQQVGLLVSTTSGAATVASGATGAGVCVEGVVKVAASNVAIAAGDPVYVTLGAAPAATNVVTINKYFLGFAASDSAAASSDQAVYVNLEEFKTEPDRALSSSGTTITLTLADIVGGHLTLKTTSTSAIALAVPAASGLTGCRITIIHSAGTNAITITPASGTIAGGSTHAALDAAGDLATFVAIGTDWVLENNKIAMLDGGDDWSLVA